MGIAKRIKRMAVTAGVGAVLLYAAGVAEGRWQFRLPELPGFSFHFFGEKEEPAGEQLPGKGDYRYYLRQTETEPQDAPQTTVWGIGT